jgi:hemolysin activation/secretion protein
MINNLSSKARRRRASRRAVFAAGIAVLPVTSAVAQVILPPQSDISRQRVEPLPLPSNAFDFRIQSPEKSAVPRAIDEVEFSVTSIKVIGATYFTGDEVHAIFAPLEGRKIVLQDLRDAAEKLEDKYRAEGFFLTRVFVAPQKVQNGELQVQVLEGYINQVFVDGPNPASTRLAEGVVGPITKDRPTRFSDLERRMLILNDMPGVTGSTVLQQGGALGSSEMLVTAGRTPNQYRATFANTSSAILGPLSYSLGGTIFQPLGRPGALDVTFSAAGERLKELRSANLRYATPLNTHGFIGSIGGLIAFARPGGVVADLDVRSNVLSLNARVRAPLLRGRSNSIYLDLGIALNRNKTNILGELVSDDRSTVAEATMSWQQANWLSGDTNVSLSLSQGLPLLGANDATAELASVKGFQPKFQRLVYSLQRTQRLTQRLSVQVNVQGQYTTDRLVSGETISFGGSAIGRGYDPSLIGGDRGLGVSGELRYALPYALPKLVEGMQLYTFADSASATTLAYDVDPKVTNKISSLGIGVRMVVIGRVNLDLQGAQARRTVANDERNEKRFNLNALVAF